MSFSNEEQNKIDAVTAELMSVHRRWIEEFADAIGRSFDGFMAEVADCLENGYSLNTGDNEMDVPDELWVHYEALRGPVPEEAKANFWFSCAC